MWPMMIIQRGSVHRAAHSNVAHDDNSSFACATGSADLAVLIKNGVRCASAAGLRWALLAASQKASAAA
jgi:hypothetical protein